MDAEEFLGWLSYFRNDHGPKTLPKDARGIMSELSKIGIVAR
jgi:hypothetical protein